MRTVFLPIFLLLHGAAPGAAAQAPPDTDIFLVTLSPATGAVDPASLQNVTLRAGYDNQPAFLPVGDAFLYTALLEDGQTEVFRYDLADGQAARLTRTPESEYSPTPMPDGEHFSTVRVEADGTTQRLWQFTLDGDDPTLILEDVQPVGYHAWADERTLGLFVLGDPPTLQRADLPSGGVDTLAAAIGRSIHPVSGRRAVSFVSKADSTAWTITIADFDNGTLSPVTQPLEGREDYVWLPDGTLFMADGTRLFRWTPDAASWSEVADFSGRGLANITRLAVSPDGIHLAFVAEIEE